MNIGIEPILDSLKLVLKAIQNVKEEQLVKTSTEAR